MRKAIDWHLAEIERLRGIKIKSRQIRRRILFHEISAKELDAMGTCTAAPVEGLETYMRADFGTVDLVTRSQAEAIIAAERAENATLKVGIKRLSDEQELLSETSDVDLISVVKLAARLSEAEANNAALTARGKDLWSSLDACQKQAVIDGNKITTLETERTMIVSHATMGGTDGVGLSVNDISVRVTALRNELYKEGNKRAEALEAKLKASEKARDDAITHRLKANHDWRVAYEALELKLSSAEAMKNIAYAAGYYQAECGLPEHDEAKEALKDWRENKILEAALAGAAGVPAFEKSSSFVLEWLSGARPPVQPEPMVGRQTFETFKEAIGFMARRAMDSQLTGLIEHTALRAETNRTAEAQEELQKLRSQYDDFSTDPRRWSWSKLIKEKPNGLRAVVAEYERRLAE